ncbi:sulfatase [Labilibacter sediminis]|nr:sulfatase [Labilibacter sediminis]
MNRLLVFFLFLLVCLSGCVNPKNEQPNVLVFVVDDLGWKDVGCFGSDFYQTPNIDALADQGAKFTNSYAGCTVCSPTRASIMTGKYTATLNCTDWIEGWKYPKAKLKVPDWTMYLDANEYTIAEAFKGAGYSTAHFGKWHLGEKEENWPEFHGFDLNIGGFAKGSPQKNKKRGTNGYFAPYGNPRIQDGPEGEHLTERLSDEVCKYIAENKDKPMFINFWFYNVHTPLDARKEKIEKYAQLVDSTKNQKNPTYAAMVEHTDEAIGNVINQLKKEGLYDNTIILFTSDNGGLIGRKAKKVTNNAPLRSGKGDMYEGGTRIPTILYSPKHQFIAKQIDEPVISNDYFPTLMDLAGVQIQSDISSQWDGNSWLPLVTGEGSFSREAIYWHYPHYHIEGAKPYSAVRKGDWKLIQNYHDEVFELYNLKDDLSETTNLIESNVEKAEELKSMLENWKLKVEAQLPSPNPNYDPENPWKRGKFKE